MLGADAGTLQVPEDGGLALRADAGLAQETVDLLARLPQAEVERWLHALTPVGRLSVADLQAERGVVPTCVEEALLASSMRALHATALRSSSRRFTGVVAMYWRQPHALSETEVLVFDLLAAQTAELLDRSQAEVRLRAALRARDDFLGLVSHELRTPLTVILGMGRVLAAGRLQPETARELAMDIVHSAERLSEDIEAMLLLARLEEQDALRSEPVALHHVVRSAVRREQRSDGSPRVIVRQEVKDDIVEGDDELLSRVIAGFVSNAGRSSVPNGPITVIIGESASGDHVVLRVLDRGRGLAAEDVDRVFEPFYRTGSAPWTTPGIGLGLAMAKRVITALGGRIWAERRIGGGMEFGFALPRPEILEGPE